MGFKVKSVRERWVTVPLTFILIVMQAESTIEDILQVLGR
jgi:hypothetical protein